MAAQRRGFDGRRSGVLLTVLLVLVGGAVIQALQTRSSTPAAAAPDPRRDPAGHADAAREAEVRRRFDEAVALLKARNFEPAASALHRVLELAPRMPEAHANMGFALLGMAQAQAARDFFDAATELEPNQANAYYGLALAYEAMGDLRLALSAMRSFLHLARAEDQPYMSKARAALWEWETRLQPGSGRR